jgi:tetratricopeptide (TPR) repeat protein
MNGRLYLQQFSSPAMPQQQTLDQAEQALFIAAQRNPADSRTFDSLTQCYYLRSQLLPEQKDLWLNSALDSAQTAVSLSPGDADLHLLLAQIADDLGKNDLALKHYQITVEIEDGFREQFKLMYPGREVFSRLGNDKYSLATQRIKALLPKSTQ